MNQAFDYNTAFKSNIGWITSQEMKILKNARLGFAGLGGVGGQYAEIFARLGVENFILFDGDHFEQQNSNRQNECQTKNYGRNKAEVIGELLLNINPKAIVKIEKKFLADDDIDYFCQNIDIYIDTLDFFAFEIRSKIFKKMYQLKKPSLTVGPIGTGAACILFTKDSMTFEQYFGIDEKLTKEENSIRFLTGLAPSLMHVKYIADRSVVSFENNKLPSLPMGTYSSAAFGATLAFKILLKRGPLLKAPWSIHYDPCLNKIVKKYIWFGKNNPIQLIKRILIKWMTKKS